MKLATGIDLIEIMRVEGAIKKHGQQFLERIYTPKELELFGKSLESLAVRFAAKEAVVKALGCGIGTVSWLEIEVLRDDMDAPVLNLYGNALQRATLLGYQNWSVSLSHTELHAIALVVVIGE